MAVLVMPSLPLSSGARASVLDDIGLFSEDFAEASLLLRPRFEYRKVGDLEGANALRVVQLMLYFVMVGHWLGLLWYIISIQPLVEKSVRDETFYGPSLPDGTSGQWVWLADEAGGGTNVGVRYICSLYWALTMVMKSPWLPPKSTGEQMYACSVVVMGAFA